MVLRELYIIDDHCKGVERNDFGKALNVNISLIRGRICRGKTTTFSIVGIEPDSSIRP